MDAPTPAKLFAGIFLTLILPIQAATDGDGYSDAGKIEYGTDPNLEDDLPQAGLPISLIATIVNTSTCVGSTQSSPISTFDSRYGFSNLTQATADPKSTPNGRCIVWVDQQNLDGSDTDYSLGGNEQFATRDIFLFNSNTGAVSRITDPNSANLQRDDNRESASPSISDDGSAVAYVQEPASAATGSNSQSYGHVYVRDLSRNTTAAIKVNVHESGSSAAAGTPISNAQRGATAGSRDNASLQVVDISGDGQAVAFITNQQLSADDSNSSNDVYVRNLSSNTTQLISQLNGSARGGVGTNVRISSNGRYVAFSSSNDYTTGEASFSDPTDSPDIYLVDTITNALLLVTSPAPGQIGVFDLSSDGTKLVYSSHETALASDFNDASDIYLAEINLGTFTVVEKQIVSLAEGAFLVTGGDSYAPSISHNGDRIAFLSNATDIAAIRSIATIGDEQTLVKESESNTFYEPDVAVAQSPEDSHISHVALSNHNLYVRKEVSASSGTELNSDTVATAGLTSIQSNRLEIVNSLFNRSVQIAISAPVRSRIDSASDVDVFYFVGSGQVDINVFAVDSKSGTLPNPMLSVFKDSGDPIFVGQNSGVGRDEFFRTTLESPGSFIQVTSEDGAMGSYRLLISPTP